MFLSCHIYCDVATKRYGSRDVIQIVVTTKRFGRSWAIYIYGLYIYIYIYIYIIQIVVLHWFEGKHRLEDSVLQFIRAIALNEIFVSKQDYTNYFFVVASFQCLYVYMLFVSFDVGVCTPYLPFVSVVAVGASAPFRCYRSVFVSNSWGAENTLPDTLEGPCC